MSIPEHPRIFISYAHRDGSGLAERLQGDLQARGFDAWLDKHRLLGGDVWSKEIEIAVDRCQVALALLSTGSYESAICRAEQQRSLRKGKLVIPVKAQRDCDVPLFLEILQYIDFSNLAHYAQSLDQLHESITHRRGIVALPNIQPAYNNSPRPSPTTSSTAPKS